MPRTVTQRLAAILSLAVFCLALWALQHNLRDYRARDVLAEIATLPLSAIVLALILTAASYVVLTGYDVLALRHVGRRLPYARVALASFISYGFSHNVGLSLLSAGSVRYRIYSAVGLTAAEIVSVTMICALTFGLGATFAAGLILMAGPATIAASAADLPPAVARPVGALCLVTVAGYLAWTATRRTPIRLWQWSFKAPSMGLSLSQIGLAVADIAVASTVLYALLSTQADVPFPVFASVYALAIFAGIMSHVPGGVGVFETVMLLLLPGTPADALLASILVYRGVYYLAPLAVGLVLMAAYEAVQHGRRRAAAPPAPAVPSAGPPQPDAVAERRHRDPCGPPRSDGPRAAA
jgi:phosphatidylglycerol lysyltransferase